MGITLIFVQLIVISFYAYTISGNNAFAFSISEEMDYSVPFDFLSSTDDTVDINDFWNENKTSTQHFEDGYLPGTLDSNMSAEYNEEDRLKTNDYSENSQNNDFINNNFKNEPSKFDFRNPENENLREEVYESAKHDNANDDLEIENTGKSAKIYNPNDKIAIINFDDNWKSQYENAKPILDEFDFKSTFYVVCDYIDGKNRMSWHDIQELQEQGHEIGSHTMTHENLDMITGDLRYHEIVESKKCLEAMGFKVTSFSYPFNSGDDKQEVLDLVSQNYNFARTAGGNGGGSSGGGSTLGSHEGYEQYTIVGWSHDATRKENNYSDLQMLEAFKEYISNFDNDIKNSNVPIIIYHKIEDTPDTYNTSIDLFKSEMKYLYENGFRVVTMDEVFG